MNRKYISSWLLVLISWLCYAQNKQIDSLQNILKNNKEDTTKVNALNLLSIQCWQTGNYTKGLGYANSALTLAKTIKAWPKGIAVAFDNIGIINWYKGNYPEALKNYLAALKLREAPGDEMFKAVSLNNVGIVYLYQSNFPEALKYYTSALLIFKNKCGSISVDKKCLKGLAACYNNIGNTYYSMGKPDEALKNFFSALKIREDIGLHQDIAASHNNIAIIYEEKTDYKEALKNYYAALKILEQIGDKESIVGFYINLGTLYLKLNNKPEARKNLTKALTGAKEIESKNEIRESYHSLAALDSMCNNPKQSLVWYKLYITYRDSLTNEEATKKTVRLEMNYTFEKKEAQAKLEQEKKEAISAAESKKQKIIIWSVCGILLLVLAFAIFVYRSYLQKQRANIAISKQKELIEEKQKEILDSIYYARRIQRSLLPTEKYIEKSLSRLMKN